MTLPSTGDVVDGKFRIERKLGEGGSSTIFEVRHIITDKKFAIKWLSPELANNELAVQRFIHEARVCARFAHPNAVQVYDISRSSNSYYLLIELLEGESLETRLQRLRRLSMREACDVLLPCTDALSAAHRVGVVHRDLKPSNIFLCRVEGRAGEVPKVLDFGISKLSYNGHDLSPITTTTRTVVGTPLYMAPEQMRGQPADPRSDIYALGIVLYELISGEPPFDCATFADLVFKIVESQPARLDQLVPVEPAFAAIVARAMAGNIEQRYATMAEFADALRPFGSPSGLLPASASIPGVKGDPDEVAVAATQRWRRLTSPGIVDWATVAPQPVAEGDTEANLASDDSVATQESQVAHTRAVALAVPAAKPLGHAATAAEAELNGARTVESASPSGRGLDREWTDEAAARDATSGTLLAAPSSASSEPLALASQPVVDPPPAATTLASDDSMPIDIESGDLTPWTAEDALTAQEKPRNRRSIGILALVGAALIVSWHTLAREPREPREPRVTTIAPNAAIVRPNTPEAEATASRIVPAVSDPIHRPSKPMGAVPPQLQEPHAALATPESSAGPASKLERRAAKSHAVKRQGSSRSRARAAKPQAATFALPPAALSRSDF